MAGDSRQDVMRWYTRALRIPKLVGKMPGGGHWPGGPYTITQVLGGALVAVVGSQTIGWWGRWGFFGNCAALGSAVIVVGFALGHVRTGGRDPLSAALALSALYTQPRAGRWRGHPIRLPHPGRSRSRVFAVLPPGPTAPSAAAVHQSPPAQPTRRARPVPAAAARPALTGVQQLLAQAPPSATGRRRAS